ncbi:urease accessory protein UreF [Plantibacter sp. CFBP 8775]|uniref:urease accessory protein UreF n=1 Tax=Plantibacter sp. CFBP 8775 TaxID=2774038 RepID=UPI00177D0E1D|nr:urease accessory UreF family protein [Plantibacter sp. CFBP 8775]MBD8101195.1 urease accessory protein [Plantibacter sp. CFBP 8775]
MIHDRSAHASTTSTLLAPASTTVAMLLADARLPSGGHAHSAGLEPAFAGGLRAAQLAAFLDGRALTTTLVDAGTAVVARHALLTAGQDEQAVVLRSIERAWAARTPSPAMREAARVLGRGLLRLAAIVWPESTVIAMHRSAGRAVSRPVVLGMIAAAGGLTAVDLVRVSVYDDAQTAAAAMLKLQPGDPADATVAVLRACAAVDHLVVDIAAITTPEAIPASGSPQSEGWAEAHALLDRRLFRA